MSLVRQQIREGSLLDLPAQAAIFFWQEMYDFLSSDNPQTHSSSLFEAFLDDTCKSIIAYQTEPKLSDWGLFSGVQMIDDIFCYFSLASWRAEFFNQLIPSVWLNGHAFSSIINCMHFYIVHTGVIFVWGSLWTLYILTLFVWVW